MGKPALIALYLYPDLSRVKKLVPATLDALEQQALFVPSKWGRAEDERLDYDREAVLADPGDPPDFFLYRTAQVKYTGYLDLSNVPFLNFKFDTATPAAKWPEIGNLADRLAAASRARFGLLHVFWPGETPWKTERGKMERWLTLAAQPAPVRFAAAGPAGLGIRTYFGSDVLAMFDRKILLKSPAVVTELEGGVLRLDLAEDIWKLDRAATLDLWVPAMRYLEATGALAKPVFAKDHMRVDFEPSAAWAAREE